VFTYCRQQQLVTSLRIDKRDGDSVNVEENIENPHLCGEGLYRGCFDVDGQQGGQR